MECPQSDSNAILVGDFENTSDELKKESPLKEVVLSVPMNSPSIIVNIQSVLPVRSPSNHHRGSFTGIVCRICHEDESQEELVSPCECSGSLGLVHPSCLERWLSSSNTSMCEICKYQFTLVRRPKSLFQWLLSSTCPNGPSGFYGDLVCLALLTPLCIVSVYLCAIGARVYLTHGLWEGTGLALLCCFLMAVYVLWCVVTMRFHWKRLKQWQSANQTVRLLQKFRPRPVNKLEAGPVSPISVVFTPPGGNSQTFPMQSHGVSNPAADCINS